MRAEDTITGCPDDERLAAWIEGGTSDVERARVEAHLAVCPACLDVVAASLSPPAEPPTVAADAPDLAPMVAAAPAPARRRRRWRRFAVAAAIAAVTGTAFLAAFGHRIGDRVGPLVARLGTRTFGVPMQAAGLSVGGSREGMVVTLRDVSLGTAGGHPVRVAEVGVTVALAAPFTSEPAVRRVRLVRPVVDLRGAAPTGGIPRIDPAPLAALFAKAAAFDVVDAQLVLPVSATQALEIDALNGGVERVAGGSRLVVHGNFADGAIDVTGSLTDDGERLALTIGGRGLTATALPFGNGRLTGTAELRVDLRQTGAVQRITGRIAVRDGRVLGLRPLALVPLGDAGGAALAALRPQLAGDHLPFDDARAAFTLRDGVWRLPRVFVSSNGVLAGGRARVAAIGDAVGRGTVRVPADVVAALLPFVPDLERFRDPGGTATLAFDLVGPIPRPQLTLRRP